MSYLDQGAYEGVRLVRKAFFRTFDFSGRSRRTEVVYFWVAWLFAGIFLGLAVSAFSTFDSPFAAEAVRLLLGLPFFALLVRRLHDQERPAWLAIVLPVAWALALPDIVRWAAWDPGRLLAYEQAGPHPLQWLQQAAELATIVLFMLPGTEGPNRHGEDPRQVEL